MATTAQIKAFIERIAPDVQKAYKLLGKVKPSVCIGMAIIESGAGTSSLMNGYNALWGQKVGTGKTATKYWSGTFFTTKTKEEYTIGTHTTITAAFRSYTSVLQGACNWYELLNTSLYKGVKAEADYKTQMQQIKNCGYMTSSTEVNSVLKVISAYDLTQYDDVCTEKATTGENPYTLTMQTLKRGSTGESVKWLQFELVKRGFIVSIDGIYGQKTYSAVCLYQKSTDGKLAVDGIAGKFTLESLKNT